MFHKLLWVLFLLLLRGTGTSAYADTALDAYNGSDTYLSMYEYDTGYLANLQDPYDFSKSWSIESDQPCEGPYCAEEAHAALDPDEAPGVAGSTTDVDPLYIYDNCIATADGMDYIINGTRDCALELRGADAAVDLLQGGVDGSYELSGCYEGKPMYTRTGDRTLFYNPFMGDWEICIGPEPNDDQLVMYGDLGFVSPLDVPRWHLSAFLSSAESKLLPEDEDLYFIHPYVTVACAGEPHVIKEQLQQRQASGIGPRGGVSLEFPLPGQESLVGGGGYAYADEVDVAGEVAGEGGYDGYEYADGHADVTDEHADSEEYEVPALIDYGYEAEADEYEERDSDQD